MCLHRHTSSTLPFENRKAIRRIALSHNARLLISVDEGGSTVPPTPAAWQVYSPRLACVADGRALVSNYRRRVVLHRFNFKKPVRDVQFSPNDRYLAVTHGNHVQVWNAPGLRREFSPFHLHRTYTGHHDETTCIDWSPSGRFVAVSVGCVVWWPCWQDGTCMWYTCIDVPSVTCWQVLRGRLARYDSAHLLPRPREGLRTDHTHRAPGLHHGRILRQG